MASPLILSLRKQKSCCGSKIRILSPAKINLYLNIKDKYSNGFHRIESIVERISLADQISIRILPDPTIKISSNNKSLETSGNLVFKAAQLLQKKFKIPFGFDIFLKKNIPIGAGLGGGSSNAASVLLGINELLKLGLKPDQLYRLGPKLGSDVNFFLSESQFAFLEGRGQRVTPFKVKPKFRYLIIWPGISLSTKRVYERLESNLPCPVYHKTGGRQELTKFFNNAKILRYALKKGDIHLIKANIFNALEPSALAVCKELRSAKALLAGEGIFTKVTGSGSALYTIFDNFSLSKIKNLAKDNWLMFTAKTF
ncbi:MAG: 4-(cytidine 5'-diphospho)-2-C-methyl-D-erythritol kinase [Candidatus Omnitrophota bacterium]